MAAILADTDLTAEQEDFVNTIQSSGEHLLTVLNDILDLSKQESGKLELEIMDTPLAQTVEAAINLTFRPLQHSHLDLTYELDPDIPPLILADPTRLRQILSNLIGNA